MVLLNQLKPEECSRDPLQTLDLDLRECAERPCRMRTAWGAASTLCPHESLVAGNPCLNLAFTVNPFDTSVLWPAPLDEAEK